MLAPIARHAIAWRARFGLALGIGGLGEADVEQADDRDVQPVQPHHRRVGLVAVIVPGPAWRDDEIARAHHRSLALHRGVGAAALDDEAQRGLRMAVRRRDLAGQNKLHAGEQRVGHRGMPAQARVLQDQHAALGLLRGDQAAGLHQVGAHDVVVVPKHRDSGRRGRPSDQGV